MAEQTTNLHLKKPAYGDSADVKDFNDNMDILDSVVSANAAWKPSGSGTLDQILRSNGDGTTRWDEAATQQEIGSAVTTWLDDNIDQASTAAIDDTLSVAHAAAEAKTTGDKIGDLKSALEIQGNGISNASFADLGNRWAVFTQGYYRIKDGEASYYVNNANAACTIIPCQKGDQFIMHIYGSTGTSRAWAEVDSSMNVLKYSGANAEVNGTLTITEDNTAYIVLNNIFSKMASGYFAIKSESTVTEKIDEVEAEAQNGINQLQTLINIAINATVLEFEEGYIWTPAAGTETSLTRTIDSNNYYSAYGEIEPGQKVYVMTGKGTNNVRPYAFLDSLYKVISRSPSTAGSYEDTAPANAAYVVVNSKLNASPYAIILFGENSPNSENSINVGMFNRIGVCGYSMDSGYAYSNMSGSSSAYTRRSRSWGAVLSSIYNVEFACYGVPSGTTCAPNSPWIGTDGAKCWQTETHGLPKLLADDLCDLYWFHMFENDAKKLGSTYLGTIADIKSDYTQNPDTFYGNYGRIMAQIVSKFDAYNAEYGTHKSPLFIFSYWDNGTTGTTMAAFVSALKEIAEYYQVPTLNWMDDAWWATWIRQHYVQNHPTFADYSGWGKAADRLFGKCAENNWSYFKEFVPDADRQDGISSGTNLNRIILKGSYLMNGSNYVNCPTNNSGFLTVYKGGTTIMQIIETDDGDEFTRVRSNGSWSTWS